MLPEHVQTVFRAPYFEEISGQPEKMNDRFWTVFSSGDNYFIDTLYPRSSSLKRSVLRFSFRSPVWELWVENAELPADPMEYPLDGLILYYLTAMRGDIMIHASGINHSGKGFLFSGISGKGKSTMAGIWNRKGALVIHDDRLIVKKAGNGFRIFNTPVYIGEIPQESALDKIFIIEHGTKNEILPLTGASAISLVLANCIQHNWSPQIVSGLLASVSDLCSTVPVARLFFKPDTSVADLIMRDE